MAEAMRPEMAAALGIDPEGLAIIDDPALSLADVRAFARRPLRSGSADADEQTPVGRPRSQRAAREGAHIGEAQGRVVDDRQPFRVDPQGRGHLRPHRLGHADEAVDEAGLDLQPQGVQPAHQRAEIAPVEAVADLGHDRGAVSTQQKPGEHRHHGVGVAGAEQHVRPVAADRGDEVRDQPERLAPGRDPARRGVVDRHAVGLFDFERPPTPAHQDADLGAGLGPGAGEAQRHPLDTARLEAVEEDHDPQPRGVGLQGLDLSSVGRGHGLNDGNGGGRTTARSNSSGRPSCS